MKKNYSKKILAFLASIALVMLGVQYFLFHEIKVKNEHISSLQNNLSHQTMGEQYAASTGHVLQSIEPDILSINNSIVPSSGDVAFIESLETLAKQNGLTLTISSLVLQDDIKFTTTGVTILDIKAKTSGGWVGTYTFLEQLESLPVKLKITFFGIEGSKLSPSTKTPAKSLSDWDSSMDISVLKYK